MQGSREILELLSKAKDTRLNLAIFFVSTAILYASSKSLINLESIPRTALQGLFFVTSIRLLYGLINLLYEMLNNKIKRAAHARNLEHKKETKEQERLDSITKMRLNLESLDIFQLYIIQELRRQNHVSIIKSATLFSLKNLAIIYTPAVGERSESASLTTLAKEVLDKEIWGKFDDLKLFAAQKFFEGSQPEEIKHFKEFLSKESINTKRYNRTSGSSHYENEFIFNKYSKTVLFSQPQRVDAYIIDPVAKQALEQALKLETSTQSG